MRLRGLLGCKTHGTSFNPLNPGGRASGPTLARITIDKSGAAHTVFFGVTSYGKGYAPPGGHKPITTIEFADTHPMSEADRNPDSNTRIPIKDTVK